ncbi:MAG: tyrosine-type recombinase/integrase [Verrucomicrobiae bacterium]|nr:tyrosine-type recombinase/integrase [Verrucomicrobiae bacterium]
MGTKTGTEPRQKGTGDSTKHCKFIASSGTSLQSSQAKERKAKPSGDRNKIEYWKAALKGGVSGKYFCQIAQGNRRRRFTFSTNLQASAEKARAIFKMIDRDGWDVAIERYAPREAERKRKAVLGDKIEDPTVGDLIRVGESLSTRRVATVHGYVRALRHLVSECKGIGSTEEIPTGKGKGIRIKDNRHDYRGGGLAKWREAVDSVKLAELSKADVELFRKRYLARAGQDPKRLDSAKVSFNRIVRNAKSIASKKLRPDIAELLVLPEPLFFDNVSAEDEPSMAYESQIDPGELMAKAVKELAEDDAEVFKAFVLCFLLGLRRSEADSLLWRHVDLQAGKVKVEPTEYNPLKSRKSKRTIPLADSTLSWFRAWAAAAPRSDEFVLRSPFAPYTVPRKTPVYRCRKTFKRLIDWLRTEGGIGSRTPIHTLRKECGTFLLKNQQLAVVSRYLGHTSISITMKHYADIDQVMQPADPADLMGEGATKTSIPFPSDQEKALMTNRNKVGK